MATNYSFEEITGIDTKITPPVQVEKTTPGKTYSFNEIVGVDEGAPEAIAEGKTADDFTTPEYLANKAKLGAATLLSMGGLPLDFIYGLQNAALDIFDDLDQNFNDMVGRQRTIHGEPSSEDRFKRYERKLPYGFEAQKDAYEKVLFGDFSQETDDPALKLYGRIAEFAGGSALPGLGLVTSAAKGAKLSTAVAEGASVTLGAIGAEGGGIVGEAVHPSLESSGEVVGTFAGGLSPYYIPQALNKLASNIKKMIAPDYWASIGKEQAVKLIKKELAEVPDAMDALARSEKLRDNIPGFTPSLGMETDSVGLKSFEHRFAQNSVKGHERAAFAEGESLKAIEGKFKEMFPDSLSVNLASIPEKRLVAVRGSIENNIKAIDTQIQKIESTIKQSDPERIGQQLRALRNQKEIAARGVKNTNYEEFYRVAEDSNITVNPETIKTMAENILGDVGQTFQSKSPALNAIVNKYVLKTPEEGVIPFVDGRGKPLPVQENNISIREFHSMMRKVNRDMGMAYKGMANGDPEAGALYYQLSQMKGEFQKNMDVLKRSEFGEVADKLNLADKYYINEYQNVFREGVGGRMDALNKYGDTTPDEKIVSNLVMGRASGVDDFYKIYGESQEAQTLLENGVMDVFARKVMVDGVYKPGAAIDFLKNNGVVMDKMPDLKGIFIDKVKARQVLVDRQSVLHSKIAATHEARLKKITGSYYPEDLVSKAMKDPRDMIALKRSVQTSEDPKALLSFRHGVAKHALKQKDPFEYFLDNEDVMKIAFKEAPEHFKSLKELSEARRIISRKFESSQVSTTLIGEDPLKRAIGTSAVEAMTMARWVQAGRLSPEYVISQMTSKGVLKFRQAEMNKVMEEALYDRGVAKMLAETITDGGKSQEHLSKFIDGFNAAMYKIGVRAAIASTPKEDLLED
ncbi:MAG: hypothetical protein GY941_15795 [Planctomycetes bacterium]|nr:hypothetical protein [Planctomycetota bacterium]